MNAKRMHIVLLGVTVLLIFGLIGGAYAINNLLGEQSKQLVDLKLENQALNQKQVGLVKAKKQIATYAPLEKITKQIVPQDKDQAEAVREIVNIAASSGVTLSSINFPASSLGTTSAGTAPAATSSPAAAALTAKPSLSQLIPVPNISGVYQLQITIQNNQDNPVTFTKFYNFLTQLENNRRTAEVSGIVIQPLTTNRNLLTFTLTLSEYIKPS